MAQRHRQGVGGIGGWPALEMQQHGHHLRHLRLVGRAVACDRQLDRARRIFMGACTQSDRRADGGAAGLSELERTVGIAMHEDPLDGDLAGPVLVDQAHDGIEDPPQAQQEIAAPGVDAAVGQVAFAGRRAVDQAVTSA